MLSPEALVERQIAEAKGDQARLNAALRSHISRRGAIRRTTEMLLTAGAQANQAYSNNQSLLDAALEYNYKVAEVLYQHGARYTEQDFATFGQHIYAPQHLAQILCWADPHPRFEQYVRRMQVPADYYTRTTPGTWESGPAFCPLIDRLLELGVSPDAFPSGQLATYLQTPLGLRW